MCESIRYAEENFDEPLTNLTRSIDTQHHGEGFSGLCSVTVSALLVTMPLSAAPLVDSLPRSVVCFSCAGGSGGERISSAVAKRQAPQVGVEEGRCAKMHLARSVGESIQTVTEDAVIQHHLTHQLQP